MILDATQYNVYERVGGQLQCVGWVEKDDSEKWNWRTELRASHSLGGNEDTPHEAAALLIAYLKEMDPEGFLGV